MTTKKEKDAAEVSSEAPQRSAVRETSDFNQGIADIKTVLDAQPKVSIYVPLEPGDPPGTQYSGAINAYRWNIPKGTYVDVPQSIAEIIKESLNIYENNSASAMR